jgi:hypothetical protein
MSEKSNEKETFSLDPAVKEDIGNDYSDMMNRFPSSEHCDAYRDCICQGFLMDSIPSSTTKTISKSIFCLTHYYFYQSLRICRFQVPSYHKDNDDYRETHHKPYPYFCDNRWCFDDVSPLGWIQQLRLL